MMSHNTSRIDFISPSRISENREIINIILFIMKMYHKGNTKIPTCAVDRVDTVQNAVNRELWLSNEP